MNSEFKQKVTSGVIWSGIERLGWQLVHFGVSIILARLLMPVDFGKVAILSVIITVITALTDCGFGQALVQKKELSEVDKSSVFWLNLVLCLLGYIILWGMAPLIERFYETSGLIWLLRILGLRIIFSGLTVVHNAMLNRNMNFSLRTKLNLATILASSVLGVTLAYLDYGAWALVAMMVSQSVLYMLGLWSVNHWYPSRVFCFQSVKKLFRFGVNMMLTQLLDSTISNLQPLLIGKFYALDTLAYYNRGNGYPSLLMSSTNSVISNVMFPALSQLNGNQEEFKQLARRSIRFAMFLTQPLLFLLLLTAKPLILLMLTTKWNDAIIFLQISCITMLFWPLHVSNLQMLSAIGKSNIVLILELIKKGLLLVCILCSLQFGAVAMAWGIAALSTFFVFINAWPNRRLVGYGVIEQLRDALPYTLLSACTAGICWGWSWYVNNHLLLLILQIVSGGIIYFLLCHHFCPNELIWISKFLRQKLLMFQRHQNISA